MNKTKSLSAGRQGFTLAELLIVIALLMLLMLIALANVRNQISKSHDVQRKADLNKIEKAMEEYYNDAQTYPASEDALSNCGSTDLSPYLTKVLCDPITKQPYLYILGIPTAKDGYVVCAKLENLSDPDITRLGCDPVKGCGWKIGYNYCVAAGMRATMPEWIANGGPTGTPTPTVGPGDWACTPSGDCNDYGYDYAIQKGCPHTYSNGCENGGMYMCNDPANHCPP